MSKPRVRVRAGDSVGASLRPVSAAPRTAYAAADQGHSALGGWMPPMQSADAEWLRDRDVSVARIRDLERNDGTVSAGIDRQVDMLVGAALRLNSKPDHEALGISADAAHAFSRRCNRALPPLTVRSCATRRSMIWVVSFCPLPTGRPN